MKTRAAVGDRLECGCEVFLAPCEAHQKELETGDLNADLQLRYDGKYSRFNGSRHNVNLERVQRIHLDIDTEHMEFDEMSLANMLQEMADARPFEIEAFVLRALANALAGTDPHHQLRLRQVNRGKWQSPSAQHARKRQNLAWLFRLDRLQQQGWQVDAAIHRIAETTGHSPSHVYSRIKEERAWQSDMKGFLRSVRAAREYGKSLSTSPK